MSEGYQELTRASEIPSLYYETIRSHEYADPQKYNKDNLTELGMYWMGQLQSPERSQRAKPEITTLLGRITFELTMLDKDR